MIGRLLEVLFARWGSGPDPEDVAAGYRVTVPPASRGEALLYEDGRGRCFAEVNAGERPGENVLWSDVDESLTVDEAAEVIAAMASFLRRRVRVELRSRSPAEMRVRLPRIDAALGRRGLSLAAREGKAHGRAGAGQSVTSGCRGTGTHPPRAYTGMSSAST